MVNAVIEHQGASAIIPLPCKRIIMAEQLASIGIMKPAHEIKCKDEEDEPIKVKIIGGESVFEWTFASLVSSEDTLSFVNSICEIFDNLPYQNKLDAMEIAMTDQVSSLKEFGNMMVESRMKDTIAKFYCPLVGTAYHRNEYGDLDEDGVEIDGRELARYEDEIRVLIQQEDSYDENNLAEYFDGSNSANAKLKEVRFSTQNVGGILYGCIRAELTEPFTPEEEAEFKDWITGQCSDGYGEGLEQHPIKTEDGELYVSYWNGCDDYFMLNEDEFDEYLVNQSMGGIE